MTKATLTYKGFQGSVEVSMEDDCLHGQILFIDDLITYEGESPAALKTAFEEAIDRYKAYCKSTGKPENKPCSGTFNIRISPELHKQATTQARQRGINLNEFVKGAIEAAIKPTERISNAVADQNSVTINLHITDQKTHIIPNETPSWSQYNAISTATSTTPNHH